MSEQPLDTSPARNELLERVQARGFASVLDIARQSRAAFIADTTQGEDSAEVGALYDAAVARAASIAQLHTSLLSREEPATRALRKLGSGNAGERMGALSLGSDIDYETWFGRTGNFAPDDSVASLFSPASYLTDMYRPAKTLHPVSHALHLDKRRPDLPELILSQAYLEQEISTLDLVNEILEAGIQDATAALTTAIYPFELPYDTAADQIAKGLEALGTDAGSLWDRLQMTEAAVVLPEDPTAAAHQKRYTEERVRQGTGLAPRAYALLTATAESVAETTARWGGTPLPITGASMLAMRAGVSMPVVHELVATDRATRLVSGTHAPVSAGEYGAHYVNLGIVDAAKVLAITVKSDATDPAGVLVNGTVDHYKRIHRLLRLYRSVPLTIEEIDWLNAQEPVVQDSLTGTLRAAACFLSVRKGRNLSPDGFAALIGRLNPYAKPGKTSFLEQVFHPSLFLALGEIVDFAPKADAVSQEIRGYLAAGLGVDDQLVGQLVQRIAPTTGDPPKIPLGDWLIGTLYRLVGIPRLAGLSVYEGLALWSQLEVTPGATVTALATPYDSNGKPTVFDTAQRVIERTVVASDWLRRAKLDVPTLTAMTAREHRRTATPEMLAFIGSMRATTDTATTSFSIRASGDDLLLDQLSRHVGAQFGLKANVAREMVLWMDPTLDVMEKNLKGYTYQSFWDDIQKLHLSDGIPDLVDVDEKIVLYCHLLAQFTLACHFAGLTEQDISLIVAPAGGISPCTGTASPPDLSLPNLYWMWAYGQWRDALPGSVEEARQHLVQPDTAAPKALLSLDELSDLQGWDRAVARDMAVACGLDGGTPHTFPELRRLATWMAEGAELGLAPQDMLDMNDLHAAPTNATTTSDLRTRLAGRILAAANATN